MLAVRLWNFIMGYVVIRVEGLNLERFINLAIAKGIYLWDVKRKSYTILEAKVSCRGYKLFRDLVKRVNCRVSVIEKRGCPFLLHKILRRKMLLAGGVCALMLMYAVTSFIWVVEVKGNEKLSDEEIVRELKNLGLEPGVFKYFLDVREIENKLIIRMDRLSWVGINIVGTKAIVDIVERVDPPEMIDKETPCNLVARRDGIINKIFVFQGEPAVREGDTVKAGQLLISGVVSKPGMPLRLVHAMGIVEARTWYQAQEVQSLVRKVRVRTGAVEERLKIRIGEHTVNINPSRVPFQKYDKITQAKRLLGWRNIILPVELVIEKYYEVKEEKEELTLEQARQLALNRIEGRIMEVVPGHARIVDRKVKYYQQNSDRIRVEVLLEALEDIGMEEKINVENEED